MDNIKVNIPHTLQYGKSSLINALQTVLGGVKNGFTEDNFRELYNCSSSPPHTALIQNLHSTALTAETHLDGMKQYRQMTNYYPPDLSVVVSTWFYALVCLNKLNLRVPFINKPILLYGDNAVATAHSIYENWRLIGGPIHHGEVILPYPGHRELPEVWTKAMTIIDYRGVFPNDLDVMIYRDINPVKYHDKIREWIHSQSYEWFRKVGPLILIGVESQCMNDYTKVLEIKC